MTMFCTLLAIYHCSALQIFLYNNENLLISRFEMKISRFINNKNVFVQPNLHHVQEAIK